MDQQLEELRKVAERAARTAGRLLREMQQGVRAREKAPADAVADDLGFRCVR